MFLKRIHIATHFQYAVCRLKNDWKSTVGLTACTIVEISVFMCVESSFDPYTYTYCAIGRWGIYRVFQSNVAIFLHVNHCGLIFKKNNSAFIDFLFVSNEFISNLIIQGAKIRYGFSWIIRVRNTVDIVYYLY